MHGPSYIPNSHTGFRPNLDERGVRKIDNLSGSEILNAFIPGFSQTAAEAKQGIADAKKIIEFVGNNYIKIAIAMFVLMIVANIIAIKICK